MIEKEPDNCNKCLEDGIRCFRIPSIKHARIVNFIDSNEQTFSLEGLEECTFNQALKDPINPLINITFKPD